MAQRNFFISSWINHVVESETSEWKLMEKLSEKNDQESKEQWEDEGTYEPMEAMALFRCVNPSEPNKLAYMKIFMQIPYVGSEIETHDVRRKQASDKLGSFAYNEREALVNLTKSDCRSTPLLLAWKQEKQDNSGLVPGEFLLYLVTDELPGDRLDRDKYWKSSPQERDDVREAFKVAWSFIVGFIYSRRARSSDKWSGKFWLASGFAKRRPKFDKKGRRLPTENRMRLDDFNADGSLNEQIWEL